MSKIDIPWMTADSLLERWGITYRELFQVVFYDGLLFYDHARSPHKGGTEINKPWPKKVEMALKWATRSEINMRKIFDRGLFKLEDVEQFEKKHSKSIQKENDSLTPKEAQELGRLRREKSKWDDSIKASLHIGLFCNELSKQDNTITRDMLAQKLFDLKFKDLPNTTIEKIWKTIPERYRKKAGRPTKNKT